MIYKLLKSTTVKLLLLVCTVLSTLILSSFLFNNQIDMLKKQIDNIYFGNLIPIDYIQGLETAKFNSYCKTSNNCR